MSATLKMLAARWPASTPGRAQGLVRASSVSSSSLPPCFAQASRHQQLLVRRSHCLASPSPSPLVRAPRAVTTPRACTIASAARCFASAAPQTSPTTATAASAAASSTSKPALDWESFFKLRVRRRRFQVAFSVTTGLLSGVGGAVFLSTGMAEPLVMQVPLDPFFTLGLMTLACAGMGWLVGPSMGNQVFYLLNRQYKAQMLEKESEFFARVRKNRVDPSNSSAGNPVPDFYGEKIQSIKGYRQWLKDQRAFNKKKTANFV